MSTVNYSNPKVDQTVRVFDEFYAYSVDVPAQEYDAVYSFFLSQFGTADALIPFTIPGPVADIKKRC